MLLATILTNPASLWEVPTGLPPRGGPLLAPAPGGRMDILVPLGDRGLGGWDYTGTALAAFPLSSSEGVSFRPAAFESGEGRFLICYADNSGGLHLVDRSGAEAPGWPVRMGSGPVTAISVLDLDDDSSYEFALGTADGLIRLYDESGEDLPGWPVDPGAQLQWSPTQVSIGGSGEGAVAAAITNTRLAIYTRQGQLLPGWPVTMGYAIGAPPVSADMNGDGMADIVFPTQDRRINVLSLRGAPLPGWPYLLSTRALQGSFALGRLDDLSDRPQLAVATEDSLVYLLDSDGTLAGTWRWPNRASSKPVPPIVVPSRGGLVVMTASDDGIIESWDGEGIDVSDARFDLGEGIVSTPAAGDINGDGRMELVVMGRSGLLAAWSLGSPIPGGWPQQESDSRNSGCYGISFLTGISVEEISGEFTGDITIRFTASSQQFSGIAVAYSTDAGYTWRTTDSYARSGNSIVWHSREDLGSSDEPDCLVRITPLSQSGPGRAGISTIFHVDNNLPPVIYLGFPVPSENGRVVIPYAVEEPEGDIIQIQAQASPDGGSTWTTARLSGMTVEVDPWLYGEPFLWDPGDVLQGADSSRVVLRARAADDDPGQWAFLRGFRPDSSLVPTAQVVPPDAEAGDAVRLGIRTVSPLLSDSTLPGFEFSVDGGAWSRATIIERQLVTTGGFSYEILWDSDSDMPGTASRSVRVRAITPPGGSGTAVPSAPFAIDDNSAPGVRITSPGNYEMFDGLVPVGFDITDREGDEVGLLLEYRSRGGDTWTRADGLVANGPFGPAEYRSTVRWSSGEDLPGQAAAEVEIRLLAFDGDTTRSAPAGPVALRNSALPSVLQASVSSVDEAAGEATIRFELEDPGERTLGVALSWSTDSGLTWHAGTISGDVAGLRSPVYSGTLRWMFGADIPDAGGSVFMKLIPISSETAGPSRLMEVVLAP